MTRIVVGVLAVLGGLAIAVEPAHLHARQAGGRVYGAVNSLCGEPMPAEVRLTAADGAVVVASTEEPAAGQLPVPFDSVGTFFLARNLTPGTYTVTAVLPGLRPVTTPQVTIGSGDTVRTDLILEIVGLSSHQSYHHVLVEPDEAVRNAHAVVRLRLMETGESRVTHGVRTTERRAMVL